VIQEHKATADALKLVEIRHEQTRATLQTWRGFEQPGPYSIDFVDKLRLQLAGMVRFQQLTETRTHIINRSIENAGDELAKLQRHGRKLTEQTEMAATTESRRQAILAAKLADFSSRIQIEKLAYLLLRGRAAALELATSRMEQELINLQLKAIEGQVVFTESDFAGVLQRIEEERRQALATLNAAKTDLQASHIRYAWLMEFLDTKEKFWKARYQALSGTRLVTRKESLEIFKAVKQTVDDWVRTGDALADNEVTGETGSIERLVVLDVLHRVKRLQKLVDFAIAEVEGPAMSAINLLSLLTNSVLSILDTELYLVEQNSSLDGQKVTTYRAITVGKLLRLAVILIIGWLLLRFMSRKIREMTSRRSSISESTAETIGRWSFGLGLAILIIYGLNLVRIPFTAFAFLGGTLAIGIGFGAQTLLKNFISGIILSLERPFKVGDLIEVENINGKIKSIGLRASVIEHFDGVETLVPNSALLEGSVNNWTYGKTALRGSVNVGVAYGSNTREVSRLLLGVAQAHGLVLEHPEPEVRFEDFGDSALVFQLLFWVDASKTQRKRLASDLRFMIAKALAEYEITIPFPQRDIHFDSSLPLRVEFSKSGKPSTADTTEN